MSAVEVIRTEPCVCVCVCVSVVSMSALDEISDEFDGQGHNHQVKSIVSRVSWFELTETRAWPMV